MVQLHKYLGGGRFKPPIKTADYLYSLIITFGPISIPKLVTLTGIPRSTIATNVKKLIKAKRILPNLIHTARLGRPPFLSDKEKRTTQLGLKLTHTEYTKFKKIVGRPQKWLRLQISELISKEESKNG